MFVRSYMRCMPDYRAMALPQNEREKRLRCLTLCVLCAGVRRENASYNIIHACVHAFWSTAYVLGGACMLRTKLWRSKDEDAHNVRRASQLALALDHGRSTEKMLSAVARERGSLALDELVFRFVT